MDETRRARLQQAGLIVVGLVACGFFFYATVKGLKQPAPIVLQPIAKEAPAANSNPGLVVVQTAGAVAKPGVLKMPADARVGDAIQAAGGPTPNADLESINLAAKLVDGTQVWVPRKRTDEAARVAEPYQGGKVAPAYDSSSKSARTNSRSTKATGAPVNLNTASAKDLEGLPGVGPSTAKKILDYRQQHGGFSSVEEVMAVKGIGPKKFQAMRKFLRL